MAILSPSTLSTAIDRTYVRKLRDQFFTGTPFLNALFKNLDHVDGGRQIVEQISYTKSPNAGVWGGGTNTLNAGFIGHMTEAVFNPAFYYFSVMIPETDEIMNSGEGEIIDVVEAQIELAEQSLRDTMGAHTIGDGSLVGGYRTLLGLKAIITHGADPSVGAYGGITRASASGSKSSPTGNAFWNSNPVAINAGGSVTRWKGAQTFGSSTTLDILSMQKTASFATIGNMPPDLILASLLTYNAYYGLLLDMVRQASEEDIGQKGFTGLMFNNTPVVQDDNVDSDSLFFVNTRFLKLRPYKKGDFRMTPWRQPSDQMVNVKFGLWMGQMTARRPNMFARLSAITG